MADAFGVYVHWPFCLAKCPYCDFNSHVRHEKPDEARYARAIASELAYLKPRTDAREVTSIFFGGGTPSLMQASTVQSVLDEIAKRWTISSSAEITLEANPTSVEAERFRGYRAAGVNRVSLGVQALDDVSLKNLGRMHSAQEALAAVEVARENFPRISFDLIYARPDQSPQAWREELTKALAFAPEHLSLYQLTIEPGTTFEMLHRAGKLKTPDADTSRALWDVTQELCEARGMPAYEISNHAKAGAESRHNLVYWRYQEYVGVGPGAHGRIGADGARIATSTEKNPERWLSRAETSGHGLIEEEKLSKLEQADEMLVMGLRLAEGIDVARFERLTGVSLNPERVSFLESEGLVERSNDARLRVTASGFPLLDAIVADLAA
ncbi:MAG: coproporphyrinogen III oxidase [Xanthobacteraceae bacterium]|nr:coproporphyrinogen III oxidase [Xanthobacteraceae bacterium]